MQHFDEKTIKILQNKDLVQEINLAFQHTEDFFQTTHQSILKKLYTKLPFKGCGKLSKGQKYKNLPYLVSDIPNHFKKGNYFCFRTMFWWGNELSFSIILSGESLKKYQKHILEHPIPHYFCINKDPWEHHFERSNYIPSDEISLAEKIRHVEKYGFCKIANKLPIQQLDLLENEALAFYLTFLNG